MKKFRNYLPVAFAAMALIATSCDDKNDPGQESESATVNPSQVFTQGVPTQVGDYVITTDASGKVAKIVNDDEIITFDYNPKATRAVSVPADYDMTMNVEWGNDEAGKMHLPNRLTSLHK